MARSIWISALARTHRDDCSFMTRAFLTVCCVLAASAVSLAQPPLGFDVSHYEGTITPAEWQQAKASGTVFAFTKATEGLSSSLNDATLVPNMSNGKAAGFLMGCYHFGRPETNTGTAGAQAEADHFIAVAGSYMTGGYLRPVLDLESGGSSNSSAKTALSSWVNDFMNRVQSVKGVEPMIYTNTNYAANYLTSAVAARTLWVANWPVNPDPQTGNPGIGVFNAWAFWQYSDSGTVPGIGTTDVDVFHGTLAQLQTYVIPSAVILCAPTTLSATTTVGGSPASQNFTVKNSGVGTLNYAISADVAWITPTPVSGTSTGELDTITVSYSTGGLAIGNYTGVITVSDAIGGAPSKTVTVSLSVNPSPADLNGDNRVDLNDLQIFLACKTGSDLGPVAAGCENADIDNDNDVDSSDFAFLQRCMNGNQPPPANCAL
jgi:lysozyme